MFRILLIVIALILYGSLFPWDFQARELAANPLWLLLHSWPAVFDRFTARDIAINIVLYAPLGMFGFLAFSQRQRRWFAGAAALLVALALSSSIEMLQLFDRGRYTSGMDVVSNVTGAAFGIALASLYREALRRAIAPRTEKIFRPSGALLLLYCWFGYELFPLFPAFSRTSLAGKLTVLSSAASFAVLPMLVSFAEWLAVAKLVEAMVGARRVRVFLPFLLLLVPLKLLIAGRTCTGSELMGAAAVLLLYRRLPRAWVVAGLFLLMLAVRGLAPFHFQRNVAAFSWVPFQAFFESTWISGFVIFFEKCFCYGAAVWLVRDAGAGWVAATAGVSLLLAAIEAAQIYLPGRTPEITDPVLAAIMAVILWLLEKGVGSGRSGVGSRE